MQGNSNLIHVNSIATWQQHNLLRALKTTHKTIKVKPLLLTIVYEVTLKNDSTPLIYVIHFKIGLQHGWSYLFFNELVKAWSQMLSIPHEEFLFLFLLHSIRPKHPWHYMNKNVLSACNALGCRSILHTLVHIFVYSLATTFYLNEEYAETEHRNTS